MALKKSDLYSSIWQSCDALRGGMDASQYKNYVLTILFVKYISDKYGNAAPYAPIKVPKGASFKDMVALKGSDNIGDDINKKIIAPIAAKNKLSQADLADFDDVALLGDGKEKVDRLTNLIAIFENPALDFSRNRADDDDILGDAYEYLMRHFATESGKSKGQFYTPSEVSRVMAAIIGIGSARVSSATTVYDPTCGSGSLLLKVADAAGTEVTLYGQEKDVATAGLARMNMILHNNPLALIEGGASTIANPRFTEPDGSLKTFDYVVANPPFSDKRWGTGLKPENDPHKRFATYGIPPPKQGDYAYLLHIIRSLKSTGKGACILPHGVLFRGNAEAEIRRNLIRRGYIKGIIGLPPNLFYGTGIPACIVVLDKAGAAARKGIFMMDASAGFKKEGAKNRLREMDIHRIVDVFTRQEPVDGFARMVGMAEIERNGFNLNIPRYIDGRQAEDVQDIDAHLRGGIPVRDVDGLNAYWEVCPALRTALFKKNRKGYVDLAVNGAEVRNAINGHKEFKAFSDDMEAHFNVWRKRATARLKALGKDLQPKEVIQQLGEDLLKHYAGRPLIGHYDVYQLFMDYAEEVFRDDLYIIRDEGWVKGALVREIKRVKDKNDKLVWPEAHDYVYEKRRFKSDLIPSALIVDRYCADIKTKIDGLRTEMDRWESMLTELIDEHSGEDGILFGLETEEELMDAWQEALIEEHGALVVDLGQECADAILKTRRLKSKLAKLAEDPRIHVLADKRGHVRASAVQKRMADAGGKERLLLKEYLDANALYKTAEERSEALTREITNELLADLQKGIGKDAPFGPLLVLTVRVALPAVIKGIKSDVEKEQQILDAWVHDQYGKLTEAEVKTLVVEDKWLATLSTAIHGEMDRISQQLTARVTELGERYAAPLPELSDDVEALTAKVEAHLEQMDFAWN